MSEASTANPLPLYPLQYESLVRAALQEDLGRAGDVTTHAIVPPDARATGYLIGPPRRLSGRAAGSSHCVPSTGSRS